MCCNMGKGRLIYVKFFFLEFKELNYFISFYCSSYNNILMYFLIRFIVSKILIFERGGFFFLFID